METIANLKASGLRLLIQRTIGPSRLLVGPCSDQWIAVEEVGGPKLEAAGHRGHHREVFLARHVMNPHRVPQDYVSVLDLAIPALYRKF